MSQLGLGNSLNRINVINSFTGVLDELGIADNAKFIFSPYKRLIKSYKDELVKVQRTSDYTSKWFGYDNNGNINESEVVAWVGAGNDGLVSEVANQANSNYNAVQSTGANKPKIVASGVFHENGLKFDGSDDYMQISDYTGIQIIDNPLTIYCNIANYLTTDGYILSKLNSNLTNTQFGIHMYESAGTTYINTQLENATRITRISSANDRILVNWQNKNTNGLLYRNNSDEVTATLATSLTNRDYFTIGARFNGISASVFYNGNIKTVIIFNSNEYNNYTNFVNGGI